MLSHCGQWRKDIGYVVTCKHLKQLAGLQLGERTSAELLTMVVDQTSLRGPDAGWDWESESIQFQVQDQRQG
jgi:hypothetical protein